MEIQAAVCDRSLPARWAPLPTLLSCQRQCVSVINSACLHDRGTFKLTKTQLVKALLLRHVGIQGCEEHANTRVISKQQLVSVFPMFA